MRDILVFSVVILGLPWAFRRPYLGLLLFSWLAYMRPQDLCWSFARYMRFSFLVAATMVLGWYVNESHVRRFWTREVRSNLMIMLAVCISFSVAFAGRYNPYAGRYYFEFLKIVAISLFTVSQVDTKDRLRGLLWVICASLAFYSVKNGLMGFVRGGGTILRGPGGMLEDNNDFALALVMNIPLLFYLGRIERSVILRRLCDTAIFLTIVTVLLTHSRGGFLAMVATILAIAWRSGKLLQALLALMVMTIAFFQFAPDHVLDRIASIGTGTQDSSAASRIVTWQIAVRMIAGNPIWGVGLRNFTAHFFEFGYGLVGPGSTPHVAHNSFLQIWAEGGSLAFFCYMGLISSVFWSCRYLRRIGRARPDLSWAGGYSRMLEAVMVGFCVGGMFLNRGHFDLIYHFMAIVSCVVLVAGKEYAKGLVPAPGGEKPQRGGAIAVRWRSGTGNQVALPRWERSS